MGNLWRTFKNLQNIAPLPFFWTRTLLVTHKTTAQSLAEWWILRNHMEVLQKQNGEVELKPKFLLRHSFLMKHRCHQLSEVPLFFFQTQITDAICQSHKISWWVCSCEIQVVSLLQSFLNLCIFGNITLCNSIWIYLSKEKKVMVVLLMKPLL